MRTVTAILAALALTGLLGLAPAYATSEMVQGKCPVMGYAPNENLYVDYQGKRIYFCCASCPEQFNKDPEKYMQKLKEMGVELEDAPAQD